MAKAHPQVSPMRELRSALSELRLNDLAVGCDGRNRTILSAFRSRTGRNQPSNSKFIFGPSVWLRSLIKPPRDMASLTSTGRSKNSASPPPCPAIWQCKPPISRPMQANGAEMLRLACCLATDRGIEVCAPVHDAVLICAPLDQLENDVAAMCAAMAEASRAVLGGFELSTSVHLTRYPDRFFDAGGRGGKMWHHVMGLITKRITLKEAAA
jgi:hypothetical protein